MADSDYVEIAHGSGSPALAQPLKDTLEAAGISCFVHSDSGIAAAPLGMLAQPTWAIRVRTEDAQEAKQILADSDEPFEVSEYEGMRRAVRHPPSPEPAPFTVIATIAAVLFIVGILITTESVALGLVLIALAAFAAFVAFQTRD